MLCIKRRYLISLCAPLLGFLAGCAVASLKLAEGETARIKARLYPNRTQMIELSAAGISGEGAELSISAADVILPPIYLNRERFQGLKKPKVFTSRLWSASWPAKAEELTIANYGPGTISLSNVRVTGGSGEDIYRETRRHLDFPPLAWSDLRAQILANDSKGIGDHRALEQISSLSEWNAQRHRREAFTKIAGLPLAMRLDSPLLGDVEVRGCALESGGAVIGVSRPDPSTWHPLGPGWFPKLNESKWVHLSKKRPLPRGFEVKGAHLALALFLGGYAPSSGEAKGSVATDATVRANLYRIDSTEPVRVVELGDLQSEGKWMEIKFDELQPPGQYVIELQALKGYPAWLAWDQEPKPVPGLEWDSVVETLLVHEAPNDPRYNLPIPVKAWVGGTASQIERIAGASPQPQAFEPHLKNGEMEISANLLPGQTEIFYLRDYKVR